MKARQTLQALLPSNPSIGIGSRITQPLRRLFLTIALTLTVFVVLVLASTSLSPVDALVELIGGAFGSIDRTSETLIRALPLSIVGLGASVALRGGVFNVGGEGQMAAGALAAAVVALAIPDFPPFVVWLFAFSASVAGGATWAALPALLYATRGVSETLSTLLLNFMTVSIFGWLLTDTFLQDPDPYVITAQGEPIANHLRFPTFVSGTRLHVGLLIAGALAVAVWWWIRTPGGLRVDLLGASPALAAQAGVTPVRARAFLLLVSAGIAGIAGAVQLFGVSYRLTMGLTGGLGYLGLLVAVLGRLRPIPTSVAAVGFAALATGGEALERAGIPRTLSTVLQAVLVIGAAFALRSTSREK